MDRFFAALRFLTILPLPGKIGTETQALASSLAFFPVIGLLLGVLAAALAQLCTLLFPASLSAICVVLILLGVSGGLHMDGLCDTADGFFSARPRERIMEIMRDSRVGAMGVMALVIILFLKIAALTTLADRQIWLPVILMPFAGRTVLVLLVAAMPYARSEGGLGSLFYEHSAQRAAWFALALFAGVSWLLAGPAGLIVVTTVLLSAFAFAWYCWKKIDGVTGDTLGAACEIAETVVLLTLAAKPVLCLWGN